MYGEDSAAGPASNHTRRRLLAALGATTAGGLAGCSGRGGGTGSGTGPGTGTGTGTGTSTATPTEVSTKQPPDCSSPTELTNSDLAAGTTLSRDCYRAADTLSVSGGTVTLDAGVRILFPKDTGIDVRPDGRLTANGARDDPVVLTGTTETRGHWAGIRFQSSRGSANQLTNTVVEYAGGAQWHGGGSSRGGIFMQGDSTLSLDGAVFRENGQAGIVAGDKKTNLSLSNSTFVANELPAWVHSNLAGTFSPDNSFSNNDTSAVKLHAYGARDYVDTEQTWQDPGVPFWPTRDIVLNKKVTVEEGATFKFAKEAGLDVNGTGRLQVRGSQGKPVTFRGHEQEKGSWQGIRFAGTRSDQNVLEYAVVEYAGDSQWHGGGSSQAGVFVQGDDVTLTVRNSTIRGAKQMGLTAGGGGSDLTLESNTFESNDAPLWLAANLVDGLAGDNSFSGNDDSYVFVGVGGARTTVTDKATWATLGVSYRPTRTVDVRQPLALTPGTTFEFQQDVGLSIQGDGRLDADASGSDTITFSGLEAIKGFWAGIRFNNSLSRDNVLKNVVIEHGGSSGWHGGGNSIANLFLHGGDEPGGCVITDSTIRGSGKYGISIEKNARLMGCSGMTFVNNAAAATWNSHTEGPIDNCT